MYYMERPKYYVENFMYYVENPMCLSAGSICLSAKPENGLRTSRKGFFAPNGRLFISRKPLPKS